MKIRRVIQDHYMIPCCLLLLNLGVEMASYKGKMIADVWLRTAFIMGIVLFGGSLVAFVFAPVLTWLVTRLHQGSRREAGRLGEIVFLTLLGCLVFWLYYRVYIVGPESVLPVGWRNPAR